MADQVLHQSEQLTQARLDIAVQAQQITSLREALDDLRDAVSQLTTTVNSMRDQLTEARGGWKTLMLLGGAASALGGAVVWVVQHLAGKGA